MRLIPLALTGFVILGSTGTAAAEDPTPEGRTFVSVAVEGEPIPGDGPLTLSFADGQLSASAGCNHGSAAAHLADGHLMTTQLATTMIGCPPPRGDADGWMARFLAAGPAWTLTADDLTLTTDTTTVTLRDKKVLDPDRPLIGTSWRVQSLVTTDAVMTSVALEESKPGLAIRDDQTVTGWTGCNTFYGRADVVDGIVTFGPINTSGAVCEGEVGEIEQSIRRVLDGPVQASIDADRLTLAGANGNGLVLRAE
jgi:heat shock protein HslJ